MKQSMGSPQERRAMKTAAKIPIISVLFAICLLVVTEGNSLGEEYNTLKGLKSFKAVFDFERGKPHNALLQLQVIGQTFKDKNVQRSGKKPSMAVIFMGPAVKLISKNRSGFTEEEQKILEEFADTLSNLAREGVKFEACLIAMKILGVDPSTILPEIRQVGNGWISLIGHQAQGLALVPVSP
jgi:intracellular sulfur oxidation DsrE/DsrF family protein